MKKIFKCLGLFCLSVAVAIGSFFVTKKETKSMIASADNVDIGYSFIASDTYQFNCYYKNNSINNFDPVLFNASCSFNNGVLLLTPTFRYIQSYDKVFNYFLFSVFHLKTKTTDYVTYNDSFSISRGVPYLCLVNNENDFLRYYEYCIFASDNFNANVAGVIISLSDTCDYYTSSSTDYKFLNFKYFTLDNEYIVYSFKVPVNYIYGTRTYYFSSNYDLTESQQYNQGYQQGLADNQQNIYNNGYNAGKIIGYNDGKSDGIASANNYSFIGLIGAVFDAPLQTFKGLLNFNVLGVNLLDFAMAMITIGLVVYIIRLSKGGR